MDTIKNTKGSEFHVVLSGLKLPADVEARMAAGIQSVVASNLAGYPNPDDPDGNDGPAGGGHGPRIPGAGGPYVFIPSKRWLGFWIKMLNKDLTINHQEIEVQEKQLQQGLQR